MARNNILGTTVYAVEAKRGRRMEYDGGNKIPLALDNTNMSARATRGNNDDGMAEILGAAKERR